MSRISNDLAGQISIKLTEKSRLAYEKLHVDYRELVTSSYEEQTPQDIKDTFKKFPDWFYTRSVINLDGHGFRWERVSSTRTVISNRGADADLAMSGKIADKLTAAKRKGISR